ncbi:hypothetical protein CDAR_224491 [Caerostris darwini]|uniref:Uncharacterized protein n=1 Tax=Caerostris darwini TaxID=1538125 RepID=A0AAV4X0S0_9ARAC|nr:hypothetical protein CDAR_224491 [Caerostris darwini]
MLMDIIQRKQTVRDVNAETARQDSSRIAVREFVAVTSSFRRGSSGHNGDSAAYLVRPDDLERCCSSLAGVPIGLRCVSL